MKTGTAFVLVAFVILGMEMAFTQAQRDKPGLCPKVPEGTVGPCVQRCGGDDTCPSDLKCCSNGCGYECTPPIFVGGVDDHVEEERGV
ncbi:WAP four-disulfide core domain protein 18-like isoform X1 [Myotis lucifugus]|uniref:WAP four-disulfide core domain protein 18-like isoform X1 n=1 Tax=Myotis lucifugus TaxID=59463 RepID=UPI0006D72721|nr:WAP four-disulfide core domain protein 18-like isoform X1 [Myotis lucifugus]